jgi:hypothetical protein
MSVVQDGSVWEQATVRGVTAGSLGLQTHRSTLGTAAPSDREVTNVTVFPTRTLNTVAITFRTFEVGVKMKVV